MKNWMKKFSAIALSAALVCTCLSGCGAKEEAAEEETVAEAASEEVTQQTVYNEPVTYSEDTTVTNAAYNSTGTDENAILVEDGEVSLSNITVTRTSDDSTGGDNSSFYGVGAAILAKGGTTTIDNATITTDADGGAGVFAYGSGVVNISNSNITTQKDTSGGIHAAGGGTLYATNVTAETNGESSAAIRSDRGGGLIVVDGGSYTSNGVGSPAIYCTATIAVQDAELNATGSEAVCIEGLNSLYLYDCNLTGNMSDDEQNDCTWNVILYQSMSGDSEVGNSTFQMEGGTLTAENGGMFYTTNTESTFVLKNVNIVYSDNSEFLLKCTGNNNQRGWGTSGANGADCTFTAIEQELNGDVIWDSISNLKMYLTSGSTLTGAFLNDESCAGNGGDGEAVLYISSDSTWVVTADSTLTALYNAGSIVDENGNPVTIKGTDGSIYVQGSSDETVTVESYTASADLSGAGSITAYEDAQVNTGSETTDGMGAESAVTGEAPADMGENSDGQQPPEMPSGEVPSGEAPPDMGNGETPPEKPDGEAPSDMGNGETPPEKPSGDAPSDMQNGEQPPEKPDGEVTNN